MADPRTFATFGCLKKGMESKLKEGKVPFNSTQQKKGLTLPSRAETPKQLCSHNEDSGNRSIQNYSGTSEEGISVCMVVDSQTLFFPRRKSRDRTEH